MKNPDEFSDLINRLFVNARDRSTGILHSSLIMLDPDNAEAISSHFSITPDASIEEDLKVLSRSSATRPLSNVLAPIDTNDNWLISEFTKKIMDLDRFLNFNFFVGVVMLLSLGLLGFWGWRKLNDEPTSSKRGRSLRDAIPPPGGAASGLCLIVPCNRIKQQLRTSLVAREELTYSMTTDLISDSVYFLSDHLNVVKECVERLSLDNESWTIFPEDTDLCIYLRVHEGSEMIGVDLKRSLSRKVSSSLANVERIGLLKDFRNLERFNRA